MFKNTQRDIDDNHFAQLDRTRKNATNNYRQLKYPRLAMA